jgi:carbamoyl-phosphate synthase large subunit
MDVINNLDSKYEATLIRKKIAMRAGETEKAETIYDERLNKIGKEIGNNLKHTGILDSDLIIENGNIYLLEMNARFGGGYPFMHFAGANFPLALVEWLKGNKTPENCFKYKDGSISAKVDKLIALDVKKT